MTKMFLVLCLLMFVFAVGEGYNLFGEAGQAYSIEINLGLPKQKLNVIVDTGSTTLAIASYPRREHDRYYETNKSTTLEDSGMQIQAKYSQGNWVGRMVSDQVEIPSLNISQVRANMAIITKSHKFFVNGSGWEGLLGLAYLPVGAWGEHVIVESWLDSVDAKLQTSASFELKLCGPRSVNNATHYGNFRVMVSETDEDLDIKYRTPVLHKRWYEVGVLSVRVLANETEKVIMDDKTYAQGFNVDMCRKLNHQKSIVDSGTTNIRLPDALFRQVVNQLKKVVQESNTQYPSNIILDNFWDHAEAACWPEPQQWSLPRLAIDLLSADSDRQYFTLEIPPQNYIRVASAHNSSGESGTVSEFCYKLGLEAGGGETVLGYTAMEGLTLLFNRSAGWIGFKTSDCGPDARITGPHNVTHSITSSCQLITPITDMAISIKAAQWALCVISIVAATVLIYLLAPCVKMLLVKPLPRSTQISMSQTALVEQDIS
ncbi:beta-secretase 1-like [Plodia interpunctella]|uniref:beta-secretase 1-like n=1 Tax=Plodia interpunctella TaxID=58824 RepID=UPI0023675261|nr:beta-secretase 1-like [Plodia interpunctella]